MTEVLVVVADRRIMGGIRRDRRDRLTFVYDDRWRSMEETRGQCFSVASSQCS